MLEQKFKGDTGLSSRSGLAGNTRGWREEQRGEEAGETVARM